MTSLEAPEPLVDLHAESHVQLSNVKSADKASCLRPIHIKTKY